MTSSQFDDVMTWRNQFEASGELNDRSVMTEKRHCIIGGGDVPCSFIRLQAFIMLTVFLVSEMGDRPFKDLSLLAAICGTLYHSGYELAQFFRNNSWYLIYFRVWIGTIFVPVSFKAWTGTFFATICHALHFKKLYISGTTSVRFFCNNQWYLIHFRVWIGTIFASISGTLYHSRHKLVRFLQQSLILYTFQGMNWYDIFSQQKDTLYHIVYAFVQYSRNDQWHLLAMKA